MGQWKVVGLTQPGAGLADAVAAWMRGPPLTDCWRVEQCVPGRPKPPLCLVVSAVVFLSVALPLPCFLSVSSSPFSSSFLLYPLPSQLHLFHTNLHTHTAKTCLLTHTKKMCTQYAHGVQKLSASNVPNVPNG